MQKCRTWDAAFFKSCEVTLMNVLKSCRQKIFVKYNFKPNFLLITSKIEKNPNINRIDTVKNCILLYCKYIINIESITMKQFRQKDGNRATISKRGRIWINRQQRDRNSNVLLIRNKRKLTCRSSPTPSIKPFQNMFSRLCFISTGLCCKMCHMLSDINILFILRRHVAPIRSVWAQSGVMCSISVKTNQHKQKFLLHKRNTNKCDHLEIIWTMMGGWLASAIIVNISKTKAAQMKKKKNDNTNQHKQTYFEKVFLQVEHFFVRDHLCTRDSVAAAPTTKTSVSGSTHPQTQHSQPVEGSCGNCFLQCWHAFINKRCWIQTLKLHGTCSKTNPRHQE